MAFEKLRNLGVLFTDRLDNALIEDALAYIDFDEVGLAFETLCDHLADFNVPISQQEYEQLIEMSETLGYDSTDGRYTHLKKLIR